VSRSYKTVGHVLFQEGGRVERVIKERNQERGGELKLKMERLKRGEFRENKEIRNNMREEERR